MSMIIKTTIRNLHANYPTASSWADDGGLRGDWDELHDCENNGELVTIVSEETDGYMNIKLPSGLIVTGINVHHLDGFEDNEHNRIVYSSLIS
jgi:hypothetical protein